MYVCIYIHIYKQIYIYTSIYKYIHTYAYVYTTVLHVSALRLYTSSTFRLVSGPLICIFIHIHIHTTNLYMNKLAQKNPLFFRWLVSVSIPHQLFVWSTIYIYIYTYVHIYTLSYVYIHILDSAHNFLLFFRLLDFVSTPPLRSGLSTARLFTYLCIYIYIHIYMYSHIYMCTYIC